MRRAAAAALRSGTAWLVTLFVALSAAQFYSQLAWLAPLHEAQGFPSASADLPLALFNTAGLFGGLVAPVLSDRVRDRRWLTLPAATSVVLCLLGLLVPPAAAPAVWMTGLDVAAAPCSRSAC